MEIKNKKTNKIYTLEKITKYKLTSDEGEILLLTREDLKDYEVLPKKDSYNSDNIVIYTDGAYKSSIDQGGWAYVVMKDEKEIDYDFNGVKNTTNNRMEISGVLGALIWVSLTSYINVKIITDSQYVFGTITKNWKRNKNLELWKKIDELLNKLSDRNITFEWTKGHDSNIGNNRADELAVKGSNLYIV